MIDLMNDFYIVKLASREEYERPLMDGPWMIGDNNLHIQRWRPNFREETEKIKSLPVWVRSPVLPIEYYTEKWLRKAGDETGKTIKVDVTTLVISRGKFARVCVEIERLDTSFRGGTYVSNMKVNIIFVFNVDAMAIKKVAVLQMRRRNMGPITLKNLK